MARVEPRVIAAKTFFVAPLVLAWLPLCHAAGKAGAPAATSGRVDSAPSATVAAAGRTLYVSTEGSDTTGDGSRGRPFRTVAGALSSALAGDEIVLRGAPSVADNRYREQVRIQLPGLTLRGEDGEHAVLECPTDVESVSACVRLDVDSDGAHVRNLEIIGGYYYGIKLETRWDWGDPDDRTGASRILIEDVVIHDTGRDAVKITPGCDDVTLRRVEIYNSGVRDGSNAEGIDNVNGDRMVVQDSYIHDTATTGIYFKGGATDVVVERNCIERTGAAGILVGFDTSPEYFDLTANPDYYESVRGIVRNNLVRHTAYAGIGLYAARDALVLNNTLIDTGLTAHAPIYFGISYQDWEPGAGRPPSLNPRIFNNLVFQSSGMPRDCVYIRYSQDLDGLSALSGMPSMDHNLFFHADTCTFTDRRPDSLLLAGTFAQWQTHASADAHSLTSSPELHADGSLLPHSPAVDAGNTTVVDMPTDRRGNARVADGDGDGAAVVDIGAHELQPGTTRRVPRRLLKRADNPGHPGLGEHPGTR
ncbi:MAG TPA: right-handed parallel beta-helix repeat-containing protein [Thermoanaerobaculaceae bacterium]|nr:right-handed parallel beta-helix repeat-containing protein [Thermoanaerobaculaceae bacterium]HRS17664.1 right-handed parallel beta-helix repeat-containing protein [Thermoanaerobaculaceae bacterium]